MDMVRKDIETVLDVRNLEVEYLTDRGPVRAVDDVSFSIAPGEVFGLAGESGCGKSTIAMAILRVLRPPGIIRGGQVLYKGLDVLGLESTSLDEYEAKVASLSGGKGAGRSPDLVEEFRWAEVSMVFQGAMNSLNPVVKVSHQITDALERHLDIDRSEARKRAKELMDIVNIDKARLDSYPHELSGGMRQRVVIAIALALRPSLMIMDEPTTALDVVVQKDILQEIERLKDEYGFSILFITHDLSLMVEFSDRIGIMYAGELVELASAEEILGDPLHPYTKGLLGSFPSITGERVRMAGIPGAPPSLLKPPEGCRFGPRCPDRDGSEKQATSRLEEVGPGHLVACGRVTGQGGCACG